MDIDVAERTPTLYKIIYRYQRTNYIEEGKKLNDFLWTFYNKAFLKIAFPVDVLPENPQICFLHEEKIKKHHKTLFPSVRYYTYCICGNFYSCLLDSHVTRASALKKCSTQEKI